MTYESVRKYLTPDGEKNPNSYRKLLAGAISGAVAQTCTYPLFVFFLPRSGCVFEACGTDTHLVMYCAVASKLTQCPEWATNIARYGTQSE